MNEQIIDYLSKVSFDQILGFIYFLIPTIITIWTYFYIRKSRFYYVERTSIKLHDDIVKNIPDLAITYKNAEINENLIFFRGTILFKSHTDIKSEDIDQEVTIYSPDNNAMWKHFEISKASDTFQPNFTTNNNKVIVDRSMLKINDYITFAGLLDSKNTNLLISHRIFNMVPKSIKLKESDLKSYKQSGVFITTLLLIIFSIKLYFNYESEKWEKERIEDKKAFNEKFKNANLMLPDIFDYETYFFENNVKIKVKKLRDSFKNVKDREIEIFNKKNSQASDSLSKIYIRTRSDKDKINLLNSMLDSFTKGLPVYINPYAELEMYGEKKLDTLLKKNELKEGVIYRINDSITVKFVNKEASKNITLSKSKKTAKPSEIKSISTPKTFSYYFDAFMNLIAYLFIIFLICGMLYSWFMYITLRRLLKIYKN